ncbi:hypothetical protein LguiA_012292 [Lonicera macranthoides]
MSTTILNIVLLYLILMSPVAGRALPARAPVISAPPTQKGDTYVIMKPRLSHEGESGGIINGKGLKNCMPKGFRHSSTPSRFVNFHTLRTLGCSSLSAREDKKP